MSRKDPLDRAGGILIGIVGFFMFGIIGCLGILFSLLSLTDIQIGTVLVSAAAGGLLLGLAAAFTRLGRTITRTVLEAFALSG